MASTKTQKASIDLKVFQLNVPQQEGECDDGDYKSCLAVKRLFACLAYYGRLDVAHNHNDSKLFESFMFTVYTKQALINDYIHLSSPQHAAQIEELREYLVNETKLIAHCDLKQCSFTSRHQQVTQQQKQHKQNEVAVHHVHAADPYFTQFCDMLDATHFYVLHLFEVGMRRTKQQQADLHGVEPEDEDTAQQPRHFDAKFASLSRWISARQHLTTSFDRFSSGKDSKFEIQMSGNNNLTYLDAVWQELQRERVEETVIERLLEVVQREEYDTDSLQQDLTTQSNASDQAKPQGNIWRALNDEASLSVLHRFLQSHKDSASSFAAGYRFYYWSAFKTKTDEQDRSHPEYKYSELCVSAKHSSFKQEIANYSADNFDLTKYNNKVRVKALSFITSNTVRKSKPSYYADELLEDYELAEDLTLKYRHLVALIMYCDYTQLSSKFSGSFRKSHPFELLYQIKRRNSEFFWFARSLREAVEVFGRCYDETQKDEYPFVGPFYCGMSCVLTMPEFQLRLNGPTSTTKWEEVALKFSGPKGVILTLNNKTRYGQPGWLTGFNCSWLSRYREEDERLFCGGLEPINIESVQITKTNQNFADIIYALCYLDKMLNGDDVDGESISEDQVSIFGAIYGSFSSESANNKLEIDAYIQQTLKQYVRRKTHIKLNLVLLSKYANQDMRELIIGELEENSKEKGIESKEYKKNLPNPAFFKVFKNVKQLNIYASGGYCISFLWLLELIKASLITQCVVKGDNEWLDALWSNEKQREEIVRAYNTQNYQIKKQGEYQCVISKTM